MANLPYLDDYCLAQIFANIDMRSATFAAIRLACSRWNRIANRMSSSLVDRQQLVFNPTRDEDIRFAINRARTNMLLGIINQYYLRETSDGLHFHPLLNIFCSSLDLLFMPAPMGCNIENPNASLGSREIWNIMRSTFMQLQSSRSLIGNAKCSMNFSSSIAESKLESYLPSKHIDALCMHAAAIWPCNEDTARTLAREFWPNTITNRPRYFVECANICNNIARASNSARIVIFNQILRKIDDANYSHGTDDDDNARYRYMLSAIMISLARYAHPDIVSEALNDISRMFRCKYRENNFIWPTLARYIYLIIGARNLAPAPLQLSAPGGHLQQDVICNVYVQFCARVDLQLRSREINGSCANDIMLPIIRKAPAQYLSPNLFEYLLVQWYNLDFAQFYDILFARIGRKIVQSSLHERTHLSLEEFRTMYAAKHPIFPINLHITDARLIIRAPSLMREFCIITLMEYVQS